jgi:CubicO group peptidase (beta-lactamase class C family)
MKRSKYYLLIVFFILTLPCTSQSQNLNLNEKIENTDNYLARLEPFGFNGTILIAEREKILLNKGYGMASPEQGIANGPEIIYSLGSIVKPFTATMIMKLFQDGHIQLIDNLGQFFPDLPEDKQDITIHHLLSHSSGLPGAIGPDTEYISKENFIRKVWDAPLAFRPGKRYRYSNVGYTLLAMILESISGKSYEQYLYETVLEPAGMENTGYTLPDWDLEKIAHNLSNGTDNGSFLDRSHFLTCHRIGNGGMLSTTEDMYRFYLFIKNNEFLTAETKKIMFTPVFMEDAYGWVNINNGKIIQHDGGSIDGNGAIFRWFPKDDLFIMIFTNSTFQGRPGFVTVQLPLEQILFGNEFPFPPEFNVVKRQLSLEKYDGFYTLSDGAEFIIQSGFRNIRLVPENQHAVNLLFNTPERPMNWKSWNNKISRIMKAVVEEGTYEGLTEITHDPDILKREIMNEIEMEGYKHPKIKVLFSLQVNPEIMVTRIAVSGTKFTGESMLMQLFFKNHQYVGMGVDFGNLSMPDMTFVPVGNDQFAGYNFRFNKECSIKVTYDQDRIPSGFSFNKGIHLAVLNRVDE